MGAPFFIKINQIKMTKKNLLVLWTYVMVACVFSLASCSSDNDDNEPDVEKDGILKLGDVSDNNPYKPYGKYLVSKITLSRNSSAGTTEVIHTFQYDKKSRIIEYVVQSTNNKGIFETNTFNFVYDDNRAYLYMNGKMLNSGTIAANGYLSNLYNGSTLNVNSTFVYNTLGQLTKLNVEGSSSDWIPSYDSEGNMITPQSNGDRLTYSHEISNGYSVDLNGIFTTCYQWEWFMHTDYTGIVFGLFDFYGLRGQRVAYSCQRGNYWTDTIKEYEEEYYAEDNIKRLSFVQIERSGLSSSFVAYYRIYYQ